MFGGLGHYVADRSYTRDAVGNVTSATIRSMLPTDGTQKTCYSYDGLRQLTRAWTPNAATACSASPSAATMGGLEPLWHEYSYDTTTGNRTSLVRRSTTGTVSTSNYTYPAAGADRPHAVSAVTGPASGGPGTYAYDNAGNMTGRPGQTITFDEVGKVSKVVSGSVTQDTVYNVDGSILLRTNTAEGASLFLGDTVLSQASGSSVVAGVRTYSGAEGKPIAEKSAKSGTAGTTLTWLFSNLEGTVDVQTVANAAGATTRIFRDPYGAPIGGSNGVWGSGTGYMNKPATASTGLTTVGARTYDPVLGKFLSVDPVIDTNLPQQNTGYTYSGNNPTTYMDPTGLRLDQGCGWGVNCTKKPKLAPASSWKPRRWDGALPNGVVVRQVPRSDSDQKPKPGYWYVPNLLTYGSHPLVVVRPPKPQPLAVMLISLPTTARPPATAAVAKPAWGPLIEWMPEHQGTVDFGASLCAGVCFNASLGHDLSGSVGIGFGLKAGVSFTLGSSSETSRGLYVGGSCSASAGPAGIYVSGGIQQSGPLTYGGAGFSAGMGAGCSADAGIGW